MTRFIQKLYIPEVYKPTTHIIISFWFITINYIRHVALTVYTV